MLVSTCPLCQSKKVSLVLDLGFHPLADTFLKEGQLLEPEARYPLQVLLCTSCGHAMTSHIVPAQKRYQENEYSYDSNNSRVSIEHFNEMAVEIAKKVGVGEKDLVVDVGGNVGTLLLAFHKHTKAKTLNIEPAPNIAAIAKKNGIATVKDFFNKRVAKKIVGMGRAKVIIATNVFNHIDGLDEFMRCVVSSLSPKGAFVIEVPYLLHLVERLAFDTIYLEHVSYFAVKPLARYFKKFGLVITDISENEYMGGSIRIVVSPRGKESSKVSRFIAREKAAKLYDEKTYQKMASKMQAFKFSLLKQVISARLAGGTVIGIGAATKGNTLLNFCGIDASMLDFVTDASPLKIGKYTPGSHIPIRGDKAITKTVTHALILPWNIADFLKKKLTPKHPHITFITPHNGKK